MKKGSHGLLFVHVLVDSLILFVITDDNPVTLHCYSIERHWCCYLLSSIPRWNHQLRPPLPSFQIVIPCCKSVRPRSLLLSLSLCGHGRRARGPSHSHSVVRPSLRCHVARSLISSGRSRSGAVKSQTRMHSGGGPGLPSSVLAIFLPTRTA